MALSPCAKRARVDIDDDAPSVLNISCSSKENDAGTQESVEIVLSDEDADGSPVKRSQPTTPRTPGSKRKLEDKKAARELREAQKQKERDEKAAAKQREKEERQRKIADEKEKQRIQRERENEERRQRKLEAEKLVQQKRLETQLQREELKAAKLREEAERIEKKRREEAEKLEKKRQAEKLKKEEEDKKNEELVKKENMLKRQSNILMSFVVKKPKPEPKLVAFVSDHWLFRPMEIKENMIVAPIHVRQPLTDYEKERLLTTKLEKSDYLQNLKRVTCQRNFLKTKLFQFHDNYRPPYYGTWRKTSKILNGRNPFSTEESAINYDDDSDAEWENDPDEGDECRSDDDEEDEVAANSDDEDDGFFVEHGYLSNDEGLSDDEKDHLPEETDDERKVRLAERAQQWKEELRQKQRRHKMKELKPNNLGPVYLVAIPDEWTNIMEGIQLTYIN